MTDDKNGGSGKSQNTERVQGGVRHTNDKDFSESIRNEPIRDTLPPPTPPQDKNDG